MQPDRFFGAALFGILVTAPSPLLADFTQQGPKLVGTGTVGNALQGWSVALSADGATAIVGGPADNAEAGATWVYVRVNGVWTQQGGKLVGNDPTGKAGQGNGVAISADGNTALVGAPKDNGLIGAAWVFVRSGGAWTQQGPKLVGTGAVGSSVQGTRVALSADGNTALIGGLADNGGIGAAWVFTRSGATWTQQGNKLVGSGATGVAFQGGAVALSADGNTALLGGLGDNSGVGAAWVFTRSGATWTQQGNKLVGTGATGSANQGTSVALSSDGNTAIVGGPLDNARDGAAWVFTRSGGTWSQQGGKLTGTGGLTDSQQGASVGLTGDGNLAALGGLGDNSNIGAVWIFRRSGTAWTQQGNKVVGTGLVGIVQLGASVALSATGTTLLAGGSADNGNAGATWVFTSPGGAATHDFDGNGKSDIAWRDGSGNVALWLMNAAAISSSGGLGNVPNTWSIVGQRDFNGDGKHDLLWRDSSGNTAVWFLNGIAIASTASIANVPTTWAIRGTGDLNGDGKGDLIWRDSSGGTAGWLMNGATVTNSAFYGVVPTTYSIAGLADFNGDGKADILWRETSGNTAIWFMNGTAVASTGFIGSVGGTWTILATGDFNGDGKADILWRDGAGNAAIWLMNGLTVSSSGGLGNVPTDWIVAETGDYNGDGKSDILWRHTANGQTAIWFMNGMALSSAASLGVIGLNWVIQGVNVN